jgi:hypothetical protein
MPINPDFEFNSISLSCNLKNIYKNKKLCMNKSSFKIATQIFSHRIKKTELFIL